MAPSPKDIKDMEKEEFVSILREYSYPEYLIDKIWHDTPSTTPLNPEIVHRTANMFAVRAQQLQEEE